MCRDYTHFEISFSIKYGLHFKITVFVKWLYSAVWDFWFWYTYNAHLMNFMVCVWQSAVDELLLFGSGIRSRITSILGARGGPVD